MTSKNSHSDPTRHSDPTDRPTGVQPQRLLGSQLLGQDRCRQFSSGRQASIFYRFPKSNNRQKLGVEAPTYSSSLFFLTELERPVSFQELVWNGIELARVEEEGKRVPLSD